MRIALWSEEAVKLMEDLSPDVGFGSEIDDACNEIEKATTGWGANTKKVIENLATHNSTERSKIYRRYKELHGTDLAELMVKEFSGKVMNTDLGLAMEFLAYPPDMAECAMLHRAMKGIGASANIIYSILCGRTNNEMNRIKKTYFDMYTKDLGKEIASELHGNMERIIFNSMQAGEETYDPQYHTNDKAVEDTEAIHAMGLAKWGTDEKGIFKILCASPPEHIQNINKIYADKYGYSLMKALEKELSGNVQKATLFMLGLKIKPYETMALLIKQACAGIGTDEFLLTCCIIRYQDVMKSVVPSHIEQFGKTIHERVRSETSGNYRDVLLATLNTAWPEEGA